MTDLTQAIAPHYPDDEQPDWPKGEPDAWWIKCACEEQFDTKRQFAAHLAAVVVAHLRPVVTTVAELDALPGFTIIGAPVRDDNGLVAAWMPFLKSPDGPWYSGDQEVAEYELTEMFAEGNPIVLYRPAD